MILNLFILITLLAVWGASLLRVDFNAEKMMGLRLPHMQDQKRVGLSQIGSTEFIDLTIHLEDERDFRSLESLDRIAALQGDLETSATCFPKLFNDRKCEGVQQNLS